jgi:phosphatidylethanolamine/phosphatidyl-N-methylethanolamine N-methyltransferase
VSFGLKASVQHERSGVGADLPAVESRSRATASHGWLSAPRTVAESQRGYRLFAPVYDWVFGLSLRHGRRVSFAALDAQPGERVLEVGVGSGQSLSAYAAGVELTGIDVSREMLAKAETRLRGLPVERTTNLLEMDAGDMRFEDAGFDKAVVLFVVAGLPDPAGAMREVRRVCRPGATIVVASHFRSQRPLSRVFDTLLAPIYRVLRYRDDLDRDEFIASCGLELIESKPVNLFGYSTVLVCRNP